MAGDVGSVADIHSTEKAYEVEIFLADGSMYDGVTVREGQIHSATKIEVTHARAITPSEATTQS